MVQTDLIGKYVWAINEGDAGVVRAVFTDRDGELKILVERENRSRDLRVYDAETLTMKPWEP